MSEPVAERWARELGEWAIPEEILAAAPTPPWGFPAPAFVRAAHRAMDEARPAQPVALEALGEGGSVLDVGAGAGAASLPLAPPAGSLVAVDESKEMLDAFAAAAGDRGVEHTEVLGRWPDVSPGVGVADVVVCHHVLYNVADIVPFVTALTEHARRRVVVELTERHPMVALNPLWKALHGIDRPEGPTAGDAIAVILEVGLGVNHLTEVRPSAWSHAPHSEQVAFARRRLCVGEERDPEIEALLGSLLEGPRRIVAMWWDTDG